MKLLQVQHGKHMAAVVRIYFWGSRSSAGSAARTLCVFYNYYCNCANEKKNMKLSEGLPRAGITSFCLLTDALGSRQEWGEPWGQGQGKGASYWGSSCYWLRYNWSSHWCRNRSWGGIDEPKSECRGMCKRFSDDQLIAALVGRNCHRGGNTEMCIGTTFDCYATVDQRLLH